MIFDSVEILKVREFPTVTDDDSITLIYLSQDHDGNPAGFYFYLNGEWEPFGASNAPVQAVKTYTLVTTDLQTFDMNNYDPEGLLLSVMVTKEVSGTRSVSLIETETDTVLETVILSNTYTTISIPQPHRLYSLKVEADLTVTIKTI